MMGESDVDASRAILLFAVVNLTLIFPGLTKVAVGKPQLMNLLLCFLVTIPLLLFNFDGQEESIVQDIENIVRCHCHALDHGLTAEKKDLNPEILCTLHPQAPENA